MGFWSKLGKGALKVGKVAVPIALAATGVGLPAAVAASAALNAADKKASGGTWKQAGLAGAVGGAMGAIPGGALSSVGKAAASQGTAAALKGVGTGALKGVLTNPGVLGAAGAALSGGAKGMEDGRALSNQQAIQQDRLRADDVQNFERAQQDRRLIDIKEHDTDMSTREDGYKQAMRANYAANYQPAARPAGVQMVRGSFNTVSPEMQAMARQFEQQATARALQGKQFDAMAPIERFTPTAMKEASLWEKMSGAAGLGMTAAGAIQEALAKTPTGTSVTKPKVEGLDPEPWLGDFGGYGG